MAYVVRVDIDKNSAPFDVGEYDSYMDAWDEFVNQTNETFDDAFVVVSLLNETGQLLYDYTKDRTVPFPDNGSYHRYNMQGFRDDGILYDNPALHVHVESYTDSDGEHFLCVMDDEGKTLAILETKEHIDPHYLFFSKHTGIWYKNMPLLTFLLPGQILGQVI